MYLAHLLLVIVVRKGEKLEKEVKKEEAEFVFQKIQKIRPQLFSSKQIYYNFN